MRQCGPPVLTLLSTTNVACHKPERLTPSRGCGAPVARGATHDKLTTETLRIPGQHRTEGSKAHFFSENYVEG